MKKIVSLVVAIIIMSFVTMAQAEVKAGSFSVTPFAGGYFFEGSEDWHNDVTAGLRAGYNFTKNLAVEGFIHYIPINDNPTEINKACGMGIEGLYHFMPDGRFVPFLAVGFGGIHFGNLDFDEDLNNLAADYGAGLKYFITDDIALRADVRHVLCYDNDIDKRWHNNLLVALGINFAFGGGKKEEPPPPPKEEVKVEEKPAPVDMNGDSDGDGVPNYLDACPQSPAGAVVDKNGCLPDSDDDGVLDYQDHCKNTPKGAKVDKDGCPSDSDFDGVSDYNDKCPNTPAGTIVGKDGCASEKASMLLKLEFDDGKTLIRKKYHNEIKRVADFMKKNPKATATIVGHTDNVGNRKDNIKLSKARANSVRTYLIKKFGIKGFRITALGYGPDSPIANNKTKEGRQKNRRVVASFETVNKK